MKIRPTKRYIVLLITTLLTCGADIHTFAQTNHRLVRLAKLVIDSTQLEAYNALLKEEVETSVRVEPGVLTLYPVADKAHPNHITILEIYADVAAYQAHLKTPHFLKYKNGTNGMVTSLELAEVLPLAPNIKLK